MEDMKSKTYKGVFVVGNKYIKPEIEFYCVQNKSHSAENNKDKSIVQEDIHWKDNTVVDFAQRNEDFLDNNTPELKDILLNDNSVGSDKFAQSEFNVKDNDNKKRKRKKVKRCTIS